MTELQRNWAGNVSFRPHDVVRPRTIEELCHAVATAVGDGRRVRAAGARHSFSPIGVTDGTLVVMDDLSKVVEIDRATMTVTVEAGIRYAQLAPVLHDCGLALHNLASLPHVTVGGAIATGTHGSGATSQGLAGAVTAIDVVSSSGDLQRIERGTDLGSAAIVGFGMFGVVGRVTLRVEPTFDVAQEVLVDLPFDAAVENLDAIMSSAYSVSLFTTWRSGVIDQVWSKRRVAAPVGGLDVTALGAVAAPGPLHPVAEMPASACTTQLGVAGPWHERLPHFRPDAVPSAGAELQSEYFVHRADGPAALTAVYELRELVGEVLLVSEIRSIAADDLWLSPTFGRESIAIHFTWQPDAHRVRSVLAELERALAPFAARPHLAKVHSIPVASVRAGSPGVAATSAVRSTHDPQCHFLNDSLARIVDARAS